MRTSLLIPGLFYLLLSGWSSPDRPLLTIALLTSNDTIPVVDTNPVRPKRPQFNSEQKLGEVSVRSGRPLIEVQIDKIVINVAADLVATGGTLLEILQRAPGISVSSDESVNMSGKTSVSILIDGRPTQLSGKDLANYLRSIPGTIVDRVEIISNPSAKYDAQGNAGIINVRLKKITAHGFNGNLGGNWTQSVHARKNLSSLVNIRSGRWNISAIGAAGKANQFTRGGIVRFVQSSPGNKVFANSTVDKDASENYNMQIATDYLLNKRNSFGAIIKNSRYANPMYTPGVTFIQSGGVTDSSLRTINDSRTTNRRTSVNLNYKYEDSLSSINLDADYTSFRNRNGSLVNTDLLDYRNMIYGHSVNDQQVNTGISIYSIKADYTKAFARSHTNVDAGLKWASIKTRNALEAFDLRNNQMKPDSGRTNDFQYDETVLAGYASIKYQSGKWQSQVGLRAEHTIIKGLSTGLDGSRIDYPDSSYLNLFPTAFLRYQINERQMAGISYSRRLNRPGYQDLNPFEYIFDNYTRESGNPYLQPELSEQVALTFSTVNGFNTELGISRTTNLIVSISRQTGEITRESDYNVGKSKQVYANISYSRQIFKWWSFYINLSPFLRKYDAAVSEGLINVLTGGMGWYATNNFIPGKGWKFQLSSWGSLGTKDGIYRTGALGSIDAGIGKAVLKDRLDLRLSMLDILNTQQWQQRVNFANVNFTYHRKWESRAVRLQLTWKFGKSSYRARMRTPGSEEEEKRIRSKD